MERKKTKLNTEDPETSDMETIEKLFSKKYVYPKDTHWTLESTSLFGPLRKTSTNPHKISEHNPKDDEGDTHAKTVQTHSDNANKTHTDTHAISETDHARHGNPSDTERGVHGAHTDALEISQTKLSRHKNPERHVHGTHTNTPEIFKTSHLKHETPSQTERNIHRTHTDDAHEISKTHSKHENQNPQQEKKYQITQNHHKNSDMMTDPPVSPKSRSSWFGDSLPSSPVLKSPHFQEGRQRPPNKFRRKAVPARQLIRKMDVTLPRPWQCEKLIGEKDELNALKDRLSDKEMITWHHHTNSTNLAGKVVGEAKTNYGVELCTQAWCKFHEILSVHDVVPPQVLSQERARLNSVHLCEAPGAFITSLNHFLASRGVDTRHKWSWLGTTLNPYYEGNNTGHMISDDRFIRNTYRNWFFGSDNSGDLMTPDNMLALMDRARRMGDIDLVTADGSIDCQENPAEQEVIVSRLHHCEVLCSCLLLAPGGTLVIKLFTMFEASSIALLYFLNCVFDKVTVCKPATSKSGNSEVYAVCSGYSAPLSQDALFSVFAAVCSSEDSHVVLLPREDIPDDFLTAHVNCCLYFCRLQSDTISRNLRLYEHMTENEKKRIVHLQELCVQHYVSVCKLEQIESGDRIRPLGFKSNFSRFTHCQSKEDNTGRKPLHSKRGANMSGVGSSSVSLPLTRLQGTFQQRQQQTQFSWQQQLSQMQDYMADENASQTIKRRHGVTEKAMKHWSVLKGRGFGTVASTQFCDCRLLTDLRTMLRHAQVNFHQQKALAKYSVTTLTQAINLLRTTPPIITTDKTHHYHHHYQHLHQQHTTTTTTTTNDIFLLALKESITSFWPPGSAELSTLDFQRLSSAEDLKSLESRERVGLVVDVTCPRWLEEEEVRSQLSLLEIILCLCNYLESESSVVLLMPPALTRLTAGLLYIFAGLFQETSFASSKESVFLHQTLVFCNFTVPSYSLLTHLETLRQSFSTPHPSQNQPTYTHPSTPHPSQNQPSPPHPSSPHFSHNQPTYSHPSTPHSSQDHPTHTHRSPPHTSTPHSSQNHPIYTHPSPPHASQPYSSFHHNSQNRSSFGNSCHGQSSLPHSSPSSLAQNCEPHSSFHDSSLLHSSIPRPTQSSSSPNSQPSPARQLSFVTNVSMNDDQDLSFVKDVEKNQDCLQDCVSSPRQQQDVETKCEDKTKCGDKMQVEESGRVTISSKNDQLCDIVPCGATKISDLDQSLSKAVRSPDGRRMSHNGVVLMAVQDIDAISEDREMYDVDMTSHRVTTKAFDKPENHHDYVVPSSDSRTHHTVGAIDLQRFAAHPYTDTQIDTDSDMLDCEARVYSNSHATDHDNQNSADTINPSSDATDFQIHNCSASAHSRSDVTHHQSRGDLIHACSDTNHQMRNLKDASNSISYANQRVVARLSKTQNQLQNETDSEMPEPQTRLNSAANNQRAFASHPNTNIKHQMNAISETGSTGLDSDSAFLNDKQTKDRSDDVNAFSGSSSANSLRTKRSGFHDDESVSMTQDRVIFHRDLQEGERSSSFADRSPGHEVDKACPVPLEIVPVLDIVNDMTFSRFLQNSNSHSISRFLATIKVAEQQRIGQQ